MNESWSPPALVAALALALLAGAALRQPRRENRQELDRAIAALGA